MIPVFDFNEIIENSNIEKQNRVNLILKDGRNLLSSRYFWNKLYKDIGYKNCKVVDTLYSILGDASDILDYIKKPLDKVVVANPDNKFIYLRESSYLSIKEILGYISDNSKIIAFRGDSDYFSKFEVIFNYCDTEYVLQVDLVKEWAYLYLAKGASEADILRPLVAANCYLYQENAADSIISNIVKTYYPIDVLLPYHDDILSKSSVAYLLSSTELIAKKDNIYKVTSDLLEVVNILLPYVEYLNGFTDTCITVDSIMRQISSLYEKESQLKIGFNISNYLWNHTQILKKFNNNFEVIFNN